MCTKKAKNKCDVLRTFVGGISHIPYPGKSTLAYSTYIFCLFMRVCVIKLIYPDSKWVLSHRQNWWIFTIHVLNQLTYLQFRHVFLLLITFIVNVFVLLLIKLYYILSVFNVGLKKCGRRMKFFKKILAPNGYVEIYANFRNSNWIHWLSMLLVLLWTCWERAREGGRANSN